MKNAGSISSLVFGALVCSMVWAAAPVGQYAIDADAGTVKDNKSGLFWQRGHSDGGLSWVDADTYCKGLYLGGTTGWRVPTKFEFETLVDFGGWDGTNPSIDRTAFPDTPPDVFWTSTAYGLPNFAYLLSFAGGATAYDGMAAPYLVRCVR